MTPYVFFKHACRSLLQDLGSVSVLKDLIIQVSMEHLGARTSELEDFAS